MNDTIINCPDLAIRAAVENGFIAFYNRHGKCIGRMDIDYVASEFVNTIMKSKRGLGAWVHTMYLNLIWKPLARPIDLGMPTP